MSGMAVTDTVAAPPADARLSPLAGKPATQAMLVDVARLVAAYYTDLPDVAVPAQRVAFGTSGHRGSAFESRFNEWHVVAIAQAICQYRCRACSPAERRLRRHRVRQ